MQEISQNLKESLQSFGLTTKQLEALVFYAREKNDPPKWWIDKIKRRIGEDKYHQAWQLVRADARATGPAGKMNLAISLIASYRSPVHSTGGMSTSWGGFKKAPSNR